MNKKQADNIAERIILSLPKLSGAYGVKVKPGIQEHNTLVYVYSNAFPKEIIGREILALIISICVIFDLQMIIEEKLVSHSDDNQGRKKLCIVIY